VRYGTTGHGPEGAQCERLPATPQDGERPETLAFPPFAGPAKGGNATEKNRLGRPVPVASPGGKRVRLAAQSSNRAALCALLRGRPSGTEAGSRLRAGTRSRINNAPHDSRGTR